KDQAIVRFIINELYSTEKSFYQFLLFIRSVIITLQDMNPDMAIGYIFKELEHYFGVFLKYAVHYRCHLKAIRRASNTGYILKIDRK
ncbi:hypothetical protein BDF21DRAFT_323801, partial [Thamnidium elegans]